MLPKAQRLTTETLGELLQKGSFVHGKHFLVRFKALSEAKTSQYAVIVSKKVAKTAVLRNKIRRRTYSSIKKNLPTLPNTYLIAFMAKKGIETIPYTLVDQEVRDMMTSLTKAVQLKKG